MKIKKLTLKKDNSARVTSSGKEAKSVKKYDRVINCFKEDTSKRTMLGKGNKLKPKGLKPKMADIKESNSPRANYLRKY